MAKKSIKPKSVTIHVEGDAYLAFFHIPAKCCRLPGIKPEHQRAHLLPVGAEYIYRAIRATSAPRHILDTSDRLYLTWKDWGESRASPNRTLKKTPSAIYEIEQVGTVLDYSIDRTKLPLLRLKRAETQQIEIDGLSVERLTTRKYRSPSNPDVLVNWFGELADPNSRPTPRRRACQVHIQVGLPSTLGKGPLTPAPDRLAKPKLARIVVVNIGEVSTEHRIRRSLSYEAIAVDLLRFLRGTQVNAYPSEQLRSLSMTWEGMGKQPGLSVLVVRLNSSAVFLYACRNNGVAFTDSAWLLCHKDECAPLTQPELGQMAGYTGFVSAQIATATAAWIESNEQSGSTELRDDPLLRAILLGVKRSLAWQRANYERGCIHMLFKKISDGHWTASLSDPIQPTDYDGMFADIVETLDWNYSKLKTEYPSNPPLSYSSIGERFREFDAGIEGDVHEIEVQINRAVAHRTQWFMARSLVERILERDDGRPEESEEMRVHRAFLTVVLNGLCNTNHSGNQRWKIPIVKIGGADLTDRREIEDFLTIHQALSVYSNSRDGKPLNIAVFGAPGSGKSFAVRQVVKHISESGQQSRFHKKPLTFNVGQFKDLEDLPTALHLVRNECLSGGIPIVFFDEFDTNFQGQPFGWLKYFLAPMQDGEFYHNGQIFKLGNSVLVFAGGVNRSFDELNGRMRNPGFCEAKGPDFISRLKAHLNVQGINRSEGDADQSRYILRRGILLRDLARKQLKAHENDTDLALFHPSVAKALLEIDRFKHGVRSLEAIIKMCSSRPGHPISPSDLPSMDQLEMHVDAMKLLGLVDEYSR